MQPGARRQICGTTPRAVSGGKGSGAVVRGIEFGGGFLASGEAVKEYEQGTEEDAAGEHADEKGEDDDPGHASGSGFAGFRRFEGDDERLAADKPAAAELVGGTAEVAEALGHGAFAEAVLLA